MYFTRTNVRSVSVTVQSLTSNANCITYSGSLEDVSGRKTENTNNRNDQMKLRYLNRLKIRRNCDKTALSKTVLVVKMNVFGVENTLDTAVVDR